MQTVTNPNAAIVALTGLVGGCRKPLGLIVLGIALVLIAGPDAEAGETVQATHQPVASARPVNGVLVGMDPNGLPVYRLPSIEVFVNRKSALAAMARDDRGAGTSAGRGHAARLPTPAAALAATVAECAGCLRGTVR